MLTARNIEKYYDQVWVLRGVDLTISKGEIVCIVGPSGSGKSTLLHILGTLDTPSSGEVIFEGKPVNFGSDRRAAQFRNQHVGFVFQFHHLLPEFTALENICIPAWIAGQKKAAVREQARELLGLMGLIAKSENKPHQLSGGEQQRVAVARALINRPDIVLADEPTGNLDSQNARELHELFIRLREQFQQAFLIVTHNEEMAGMSDRVLRMADGRLS